MAQKVYFLAGDNAQIFNSDLWVSDGTSSGTHPIGGPANTGVTDAATDGLGPAYLTVFGDDMIFGGSNSLDDAGTNGLFLTDGTPVGTTEVGGPSPGTGTSPITGASNQGLHPSNFTVFGSKAIFTGLDDSPGSGFDGLWVTDGTTGGTIELGGLGNQGIAGSAPSVNSGFSTENFAAFGNSVLFDGRGSSGTMGLWISDGTTAGTVEIGGLDNTGIADAGSSFTATDFITLGELELFNAESAGGNQSLWVTDGTAGGTVEVGGDKNAAIAGANNTGLGNGLAQAVRLGNRVFFSGNDSGGNNGLWTTDGTATGTMEIGGIGDATGVANVGPLGLDPTNLVTFGAFVLFNGEDSNSDNGLWLTDGAANHTLELSGDSPNEAANGLQPEDIVDLGNGKAVFIGFDDSNGQNSGKATLWVTDGTVLGTQEIGGLDNASVTGINAANGLNPEIGSLMGGDGLAYFIAQDSAGQEVLFETDGSLGGTKIVPGTNVDSDGLVPQNLTLGPVPAADSTVSTSGANVTLSDIPGQDLTLEAADATPDTVTGSNGSINLVAVVASIIGGGNLISMLYKLGQDYGSSSVKNSVTLKNTGSNKDTVVTGTATNKGAIILGDNAQANVYGEDDTITFASTTGGNVVSIYETDNLFDTVNGSNGTINIVNAQANVNGSNDTINLIGSGDTVTTYGSTAGFNTVNGSNGTININSGGEAYVNGAGNTITLASGGTLSVASGKTLSLNKTESISGAVTGAGQLSITGGVTTFANGATLSVAKLAESGAATKLYMGTLSYGGALTQTSGTLTVPGTLTLTGTNSFAGAINGAGTLAVTGGSTTIQNGTNLAVAKVQESGAATKLSIGTLLYANALTVSSGTLTLPGTLTLKGTNSLAGTINGAGTLAVAGGSTTIQNGATLSVAKVALSGATSKLSLGTLSYGGALTVSSGTLTLPGTLTLTGANVLTGAIGGAGQLTVAGGSTTINTGSNLTVAKLAESGASTKLSLGTLTYAGALTMSSGTLTLLGTLTLPGTNNTITGTINGAGKLAITGGNTKFNAGTALSMASWSISGAANVTLAEAATYAGAFAMSGGTLALGAGNLTLSGADTFTGGTVVGAHVLLTSGTAKSVSGFTVGTSTKWQNTSTVNENGASVTIGASSGTSALDNTSTGIYDLLGDVGLNRGTSTTSAITNEGLLEKTGGTGISTIVPGVTNTGTIKVTKGTLDIKGAVTGTGADTIVGTSTLEFDGAVASGQSIYFNGNGGTLDLGAPQSFAGAIKGFDLGTSGDAIDVLSGWTFTGATEGATSTTLAFVDGATHLTLTLAGAYTGTFSATAITGGTKITYAA